VFRYGLLLILIVVVSIFALISPGFYISTNVTAVLRAASIAAIMYVGATWVFAIGEIDVCFMHVAAVTSMLVAKAVPYGWPAAIGLGIAAGAGFGLLNGVLVGLLGLPSLIVTIATGGLAASLAAAIGRGAPLGIADTGFVGYFMNLSLDAFPAVALLAATCYALAWYLQERLLFGQYLYAIAENRRAAIDAGVPVRKLLVILFTLSSGVAAIAGVLLAAELASGQPRIGTSYFLDGLTAIFLGALVIRPSQPNVFGTLTGVLLLATLVSGTALLGWADWQQQMLKGALLLLSLVVTFWARRFADGLGEPGSQ
jgi:ribose transport system permease protein